MAPTDDSPSAERTHETAHGTAHETAYEKAYATAHEEAYIVTGPTSGIGLRAALELARHATVVLVGRDPGKLDGVRETVEARGGTAVTVVCDLAEPASVRAAAARIVELGLPLAGLLNNAGVFPNRAGANSLGWDLAFATNHLGPFALTEALVPHLPDGAHVVFVCSGVEDPERRPAVVAGFRGARYVSAEASARGEWLPGGSKLPGGDAYATSKQCNLATVLAFAREAPRLRFTAVEPGFSPATDLGRDSGIALRALGKYVLSPLAPLVKYWSNPKTAGRVIACVLTDGSVRTGGYYDEKGRPMEGSAQVREPEFQDRVVAETRVFLTTVPA
ncbi:SDR family NAD(P)-dependent oxidoreductase [Streptomyces sp. NPDC008139]|uniref:SDR family NAD(P)-dependent oxidoreductase n=1 Tax=Streptomyces sp. NPDC008139 TaxID=3364814 RepID=UPI0036ECFE73